MLLAITLSLVIFNVSGFSSISWKSFIGSLVNSKKLFTNTSINTNIRAVFATIEKSFDNIKVSRFSCAFK